jgi:hypothetical protein
MHADDLAVDRRCTDAPTMATWIDERAHALPAR